MFGEHQQLKVEILEKFNQLRAYGVILRSVWMIAFMMIIINQKAPSLTDQYNLDQSWFNRWIREQGHWTRRRGSTCVTCQVCM